MNLNHLLAASAALALCSGAAWAQTPPADAGKDQPPASAAASGDVTAPAPSTEVTTSTTAAPGEPTVTSTTATSATASGANVSVTTSMVTNGPVPDTAENRAKYGQPLSNAGKRTAARGN